VILRILRKLIIHRLLTLGRVYRIIVFVTSRKIRKMAKQKGRFEVTD